VWDLDNFFRHITLVNPNPSVWLSSLQKNVWDLGMDKDTLKELHAEILFVRIGSFPFLVSSSTSQRLERLRDMEGK
jgi:hypothetical protein